MYALSLRVILIVIIYVASLNIAQQNYNRVPAFDTTSFKNHINILGSDFYEGRGTGTIGGNLASLYLAEEFSKLKLKPIGNDESYYQYIPMHGSKPSSSSALDLLLNDSIRRLKLYEEYLILSSGEQTFIPVPLEIVFVGYGIVAPEFDYNDYSNIDAEGKIVVFFEGEPVSNSQNYFNGISNTVYSLPEAKRRTAISRGARGSILIPNPLLNFNWEQKILEYSFESITPAYSVTSNFSIMINPDLTDLLLKETRYTLEDILLMHSNGNMKSFPLDIKLSFKGEFQVRDFLAPNVIGLLEGSDKKLKDSYLIVSAHYDHLGIGPVINGDSIYNGVFDNAAGVSALLEIAKEFSKLEIKPKRSIVFLLTTGEENGLLGSKYYVENPVVPLYKTIANINIDGIASFDRFKSIVGVGKEYSTLEDYLELTANKLGLKLGEIPKIFNPEGSFTKSDQISFAQAGIPSMLVLDGIDYENAASEIGIQKIIEYSSRYYHTPFDDLNLPFNYDAAIQHLEVLYTLIKEIANSKDEPKWKEGTPFINTRLRSIAEKR